MQTLKARFNLVTLDMVEAWLQAGSMLPPRATLVTFDDGYRDLYDTAFPVLQKYAIPAVVFLPSGYVGSARRFWWDTLAVSLRKLDWPIAGYRWILDECPPQVARVLSGVPAARGAGRAAAIESVVNKLKSLDPGHVAAVVDRLWVLAGSPSIPPGEYGVLAWDQVREMSGDGISFGSHTVHHTILTMVNRDIVERELRESKESIEVELGKPVTALCYPSGAYADSLAQAVSRCGYLCAFSTVAGTNRLKENPFALKRVGADNSVGGAFEVRLLDSYHAFRRLLHRS